MSGIYGIYRYDGAPPDPGWMERMRSAMGFYGPHGGQSRVEGVLGLGHLLLEVNPEDAQERQPVQGERGPVVSAARLDNRADLLEAFGIPAAEAALFSDGHLVSLAFDRWGDELSTHLHGDWALAAWDARNRRLLLARDACGNATLYFHEGKGFFAFASSLKALLALPGVERQPDRLRLAELLVSWQHDAELTAYQGFRRLVWAHSMTVGPQGQIRTWRHWSAEGREPLAYRRDEEYEEAFRECLTRAVAGCLRTRKPVAATLSGGRDSGSVVATAAPLLAAQGRPLVAYTSVPLLAADGAGQHRLGNEWDQAHATSALAGPNVEHVALDAAGFGVIAGIEHFLDVHDGPSHAANNHYWLQALTVAASRQGAAVVLTGQMGNAAVSWEGNGSALLALAQGRTQTALRLLLHAEPSPWLTLKRQLLKPLFTPGLRLFRRIPRVRGSQRFSHPWQAYSALHPAVALEFDLDRRMKAARHDSTFTFSPGEDRRLRFFRAVFGIGAGLWSELGAAHSVAYLDPTVNLPLVEFVLRVPDDRFRRRGQTSWLLRRAMRDRLPAAVLEGRQKGLQAADLGHRILCELPQFRQILDSFDALPPVREFLDVKLLRRCLDDLAATVDPETSSRASQILLRGLGVGLFLRRLI